MGLSQTGPWPDGSTWRHGLLAALVVGSFLGMMSLEPIPQRDSYHEFADRRAVLGIPNFLDVATNLPFLLVGLLGLRLRLPTGVGSVPSAWRVFFAGVALVGFGSAYYHWAPDSATLVWDRLPMTVGFMGLFAALLGEYVHERLARVLLAPAVGLGLASVLYWHGTDDLRPYYWVQLVPLLTVPAVMVLYRRRTPHQWLLAAALGWYLLAKGTEALDAPIYDALGQTLSGHSLKHLLAAAACASVLLMLRRRDFTDRG